MAERWQQWMPHDIDSWQGSANIQALSDLAYRAVHNLLMDMWKQPDCALPSGDRELAKRSRIAQRWAECRDEVMEYFSDRTEDGRITHRVLFKKWNEAREVYEKRQNAAKKTNSSRSANGDRGGHRDAQPTVTARTPSRSADTGTSTGTETNTKESTKTLASTARAVPAARGKLVCTLPLNTGDHEVFEADVQEWIPLYPAVDIRQELRTMKGWLLGSPQRRKTKTGIGRFINSWFARAQNEARPGAGNGTTQGNHKPNAAIDRQRISHDAILEAGRRRYGIGAADADGRSAGSQTEPDIAAENAGCVPPGMGGDCAEVRFDDFQGRTLEGTP